MQRLFSTFANSWPGFGLLVQRLALSGALIHGGVLRFEAAPGSMSVLGVLETVLGLLLGVGLWTPIAGVLAVMIEVRTISLGNGNAIVPALLAVLGGTLAMIGPGAWSVDARLFGRKHIAG